jgi:hypothetical protein
MMAEEFRAAHERTSEGCWSLLKDHWTESASTVAKTIGAEVLFQPDETISNHLFTDHRFCTGSVCLEEGLSLRHPATDFAHMNAQYGATVLEKLLSWNAMNRDWQAPR